MSSTSASSFPIVSGLAGNPYQELCATVTAVSAAGSRNALKLRILQKIRRLHSRIPHGCRCRGECVGC